jgi:hypothetical protein
MGVGEVHPHFVVLWCSKVGWVSKFWGAIFLTTPPKDGFALYQLQYYKPSCMVWLIIANTCSIIVVCV